MTVAFPLFLGASFGAGGRGVERCARGEGNARTAGDSGAGRSRAGLPPPEDGHGMDPRPGKFPERSGGLGHKARLMSTRRASGGEPGGPCLISGHLSEARCKGRDAGRPGGTPGAPFAHEPLHGPAVEAPAAASPGEGDSPTDGLGRGRLSRAPVLTGASELKRQRGCARRERRPNGPEPEDADPTAVLAPVPCRAHMLSFWPSLLRGDG